MNRTVSDLILEQLAAYGVTHIFGVIGDAIFPLADALARQNKIRFVSASIETGAAFMAAAYAQIEGRLGVCIGTSGPGAANLANGVAAAYLDGMPLLCLTGQVATTKLGTEAKQDISQTRFFSAITAKSHLCAHPDALVPILTELINHALTAKTAVHLGIPQDILSQPTQNKTASPVPLTINLVGTHTFNGNLNSALELIAKAQRPLIVLGPEVRSEAEPLRLLAANLGAGIIIAQEAKGTLSESDPLVIGGVGEAFLPEVLTQTDLILLFGTVSGEARFFPATANIIQFREDFNPDQNQYQVVRGDLAHLIQELSNHFPNSLPRTEWRHQIAAVQESKLKSITTQSNQNHPVAFLKLLSTTVNPEALIALDVGEFLYWFNLGFIATRQQVLLSSKWRSMGSGIPAGIAACLHSPQRQVVTIVGDGGLLMSLAELNTIVRQRLPLVVFVLKNDLYGLEVQKMTHEGFTPFATDLVIPDLSKIAAAFALNFYHLTDLNNGAEIIKEALTNPPALVEVAVASVRLPNL